MNRRLKITLIAAIVVVAATGAGIGATIGLNAFLAGQYTSLHDGCVPSTVTHTIIIQDDKVSPEHIDANRCELLTVKNLDNAERLMAFGVHEKHISYDGISEQMLQQNDSFTVTLVQTGDFKVHDHENDDVKATFTVD